MQKHIKPKVDTSALGETMTRVGFSIVIFSVICVSITFFILLSLTPIRPESGIATSLYGLNLLLIIIMTCILAWAIRKLWRAWRNKEPGAELHIRLVTLFGLVSLIPAIALAIFATYSVDRVLEHWFSSRTKAIVENSMNVAKAYVKEHGQVIRSDIVAMTTDIDQVLETTPKGGEQFIAQLSTQTALRALNMSYLIDQNGKIISRANMTLNLAYQAPSKEDMARARDGEVVILAPKNNNVIRAVKKLESNPSHYLYVWRYIDPNIIAHLRKTRRNEVEYRALEKNQFGIQIAFGLLYVTIALTLLLAALWFALWLANRLVSPIRDLITASQKVSEGDLAVRVHNEQKTGDIHDLSRTFNVMIEQLDRQRSDLVTANHVLDERRQFIEAVLAGVSTGIIGINEDQIINLANEPAISMLALTRQDLIGKPLSSAIPYLNHVFKEAINSQTPKRYESHIKFPIGGEERNFVVCVTQEHSNEEKYGYVITFDDISDLVTAQRTSAWADIAQRIAHEIKNPLTPIQLSAERLKRRYAKTIASDDDVFLKCTDTIIRQVGDIGQMVDEFSSFARSPKPSKAIHNLVDVVREAMTLYQVGESHIKFEADLPDKPVKCNIDRRLISQAITNLVKNASEAVEARAHSQETVNYQGWVRTRLNLDDDFITISVSDNGCGLPKKNRARLTEPYVTTREKGTGLGLAIVQKIAEQHGGAIELSDLKNGEENGTGTTISIIIPHKEPKGEHDISLQTTKQGAQEQRMQERLNNS